MSAEPITTTVVRAKPRRRARSRVAVVSLTAVVLGLVLGTAACGGSTPEPTAQNAAAPAPAALQVPAGQHLVLSMTVLQGSQVYGCTHGGWSLIAPAAVLTGPGTDVLHTAGPRWTAVSDGSSVTAAQVASLPTPGAAPQLLLRATGHDGQGVLSAVDYVQRLSTQGGAVPAGPCPEGRQQAVGYTAEYRFYAPGP